MPGMSLLSDLRHGLRMLAHQPFFALTAIASLAMGIAAAAPSTAWPMPCCSSLRSACATPGEVVDIGRANRGSGFDNMSHPAFKYLRDHTQTLERMAAVDFGGGPMSLHRAGVSERVIGTLVSAQLLRRARHARRRSGDSSGRTKTSSPASARWSC